MKKLLITFLILLSPLVSAQTGKLCEVFTTDYGWGPVLEVIKDRGCERDDVLQLSYVGEIDLEFYFAEQTSRWCRLDRDIQIYDGVILVCILVSNEPRPSRPRKSRSE